MFFAYKLPMEPIREGLIKCANTTKGNGFLAKIRLLWEIWCIVRDVRRCPDPRKGVCIHPDTHKLFDLEDWFFEHERNKGRKELFRAIFKITQAKHATDSFYAFRLSKLFAKIKEIDWMPPSRWAKRCWDESGRVKATWPPSPELQKEIDEMKEPQRFVFIYDYLNSILGD